MRPLDPRQIVGQRIGIAAKEEQAREVAGQADRPDFGPTVEAVADAYVVGRIIPPQKNAVVADAEFIDDLGRDCPGVLHDGVVRTQGDEEAVLAAQRARRVGVLMVVWNSRKGILCHEWTRILTNRKRATVKQWIA